MRYQKSSTPNDKEILFFCRSNQPNQPINKSINLITIKSKTDKLTMHVLIANRFTKRKQSLYNLSF